MPSPIRIVNPADADTLWVVRDRIRFIGEVPGTELAILEVEVPPGSGTPPHHHASPEIFRVLAGEISFARFAEGAPTWTVAGPGTVVTVPSGAPHGYRNDSAAPASLLVVVERPMVGFFRDLGRKELPPAGPPTDAEIAAVVAACNRHQITLLGGAPA